MVCGTLLRVTCQDLAEIGDMSRMRVVPYNAIDYHVLLTELVSSST